MTETDQDKIITEQEREQLPLEVFPMWLAPEWNIYPGVMKFAGELLYQAREKWWKENLLHLLPEGVGEQWNHLLGYVNTAKSIPSELQDVIAAYPDEKIGRTLAEQVALSPKTLAIVLMGVNYEDGTTDLNWWEPEEVIKNQKKLGVSDEVIEEAKRLILKWHAKQQLVWLGLVPVEGGDIDV